MWIVAISVFAVIGTICCIVWMQTLVSWGFVFVTSILFRVYALIAFLTDLVSCLLGTSLGSALADNEAELWRRKMAWSEIDSAYVAKDVAWLRDLAGSEDLRKRDHARFMLDLLLDELNGPVTYQEKLVFPEE